MNQHHMKRRCPDTHFLGPALLSNYRLAFLYPSTSFPGGGAADIVKAKGMIVEGALYFSCERDMKRLDSYEDVHLGGYRRINCTVLFSGQKKEATTYEVVEKLGKDFSPTSGYRDVLLSGAKMSGLSSQYINHLEKIPAQKV